MLACAAAVLAFVLIADGALHALLAQNPFGARAPPEPQVGGIVGWLLTKQSEFYREMSSTIRAAKSDGSAVWTLLAISFAYGIFHAAGPGHGKAVISSYLVANEETARRGIALSFASALMQSLVAVLIVGIGAWLLNVTAKTMCGAERVIEIASYALIAAFGAAAGLDQGRRFHARAASAAAGRRDCPAGHRGHDPHEHHHDHDHDHAQSRAIHGHAMTTITTMTTCMTSIAAIPTVRSRRTRRSRRLAARPWRDFRGRHPAVFGRDPGAGIRAGAGAVLGRRRRDLRDGPRHRDHRRHHRRHRGVRQGPGAPRLARVGRDGGGARWSCAA